MKDNKPIEIIKEEVLNLKSKGNTMISIDSLLVYLDALKKEIVLNEGNPEEKATVSLEYNYESFKATITYGQEALKSAILINGGASIAILTFTGNVWSKSGSEVAYLLAWSLLCFATGTLFAAMGPAASYMSQCYYTVHNIKLGNLFRHAAIVVVILSYMLFFFGILLACKSFFGNQIYF